MAFVLLFLLVLGLAESVFPIERKFGNIYENNDYFS